MTDPKVQLRAQVKIAEKELDKARAKEALLANKVRAALQAGQRERAVTFAEALNEARDELAFAEKRCQLAKAMEQKGRGELSKMGDELTRLKQLEALSKAQNGLASALEMVQGGAQQGGAADIIRKLEEEAALNEARLDIAMDDARQPGLSAEAEAAAEQMQAEDILRQMELDLGVEGRDRPL